MNTNDLQITNESIRADIRCFETRICKAKKRLAELPPWADTYGERQANKKKRYILEGEIIHVQNLIDMAKNASKVMYFPRPEK